MRAEEGGAHERRSSRQREVTMNRNHFMIFVGIVIALSALTMSGAINTLANKIPPLPVVNATTSTTTQAPSTQEHYSPELLDCMERIYVPIREMGLKATRADLALQCRAVMDAFEK